MGRNPRPEKSSSQETRDKRFFRKVRKAISRIGARREIGRARPSEGAARWPCPSQYKTASPKTGSGCDYSDVFFGMVNSTIQKKKNPCGSSFRKPRAVGDEIVHQNDALARQTQLAAREFESSIQGTCAACSLRTTTVPGTPKPAPSILTLPDEPEAWRENSSTSFFKLRKMREWRSVLRAMTSSF